MNFAWLFVAIIFGGQGSLNQPPGASPRFCDEHKQKPDASAFRLTRLKNGKHSTSIQTSFRS